MSRILFKGGVSGPGEVWYPSMHRGRHPPGQKAPWADIHPPGQTHTPLGRHIPPWADTPMGRHPLGRHPLDQTPSGTKYTPLALSTPLGISTPPGTKYTPGTKFPSPGTKYTPLQDTVNVRAVCILLECNLV